MSDPITNLQPAEVFRFFREICAIPHGTGNLKGISDYLVSFAKERGLEVRCDDFFNVLVKKDGSPGREKEAPVILQGHIDMVAVADKDSGIDMQKDPLRVRTDGEWIFAEGTSLGGDDGIAVAMCLALLDADDISHPPLEIVLTADEEGGMDGARELDVSSLKSRRLINIDNEEEGVILAGCAGGVRVNVIRPIRFLEKTGIPYTLGISGLAGGHSGAEIHLGRGNANILLARALYELRDRFGTAFSICEMKGGDADNAIAQWAKATILFEDAKAARAAEEALEQTEEEIKNELLHKDPDLKITLGNAGEAKDNVRCIDDGDADAALGLILGLPNGVQAMSASMPGLVETSLNLGILLTDPEGGLTLRYAVRSGISSSKRALLDRMRAVVKAFGAEYGTEGDYPGWEFRPGNPLQTLAARVYKEQTGKEARIEAIHAGVECGFFAEKIPGLDCISIGPDMCDIHTTREKLSVPSTARTWDYLKALLKGL